MKNTYFKKVGVLSVLAMVLLFMITVIIFLATLKIKFHWIDDSWMVFNARRLLGFIVSLDFSGMANVFLEKNTGRLRPVLWLWKTAVYVVADNIANIHYFFRHLLIAGTSVLIYKIVFHQTKSRLAGLFSSTLFLLVPINTENWYRLGPVEPLLGFLIIASIYILFRYKNVIIASLFLFLAFFTKETTIALVPALVVYYFIKLIADQKDKKLLKYIFFAFLFLALSLLITFSMRRGYSTFYEFNYQESFMRFRIYLSMLRGGLPLGSILLGTFLLRNFSLLSKEDFKKFDKLNAEHWFFLFFPISYVAVQSPWIWVMNRYLLPATIGCVIFMGIELFEVFKLICNKSKGVFLVILIGFVAYYTNYVAINLLRTFNTGQRVSHGTQNVQQMLKYLADNTKQNGKVYFNSKKGDATMEHLKESDRHLDIFYERPDIEVKYLEEKDLSDNNYIVVNGPGLSFHYFGEDELLSLKNLQKVERIERTDNLLVVTTPINIIKQLTKKIVELIFKGKELSAEGIYSFYQMKSYWSFYHIRI